MMHSIRPLFLSTYPPEECDIAVYAKQTADSIDREARASVCAVAAIRKTSELESDDPRIVHIVHNSRPLDYELAARFANDGPCDVVSVQHRFDLFPGEIGERILEFVRNCRKPMITTFHELLSHPSPPQRRLIQELARLSCGIVVLTTAAARLLAGAYHVSAIQPVCVILHAKPDAPHKAVNHRAEGPLDHDSARHEWTPVQARASAKPTLWSQEGAQYWELFDQILATRDKRLGSRFLASFARPPNKDHG